ncbi:MAG: aminotransferase class I/II-fold pyridoxal phosphate-dependent enzyme [Eubacteriales bacterium]|nr:aminotransferase class I/II-fold pyridoxal phosphate-dependent enzyme [Eubacteriales bacterium]MDD3199982.1 aminotransferase class I/II-fold pyridoxal phosphate-dependent enzyme [Eubacteriales bacterium]MDD4630195.1 aminotransferase class I/II-fold pyridoxal phosphate-dependent enzyme [Eubacteriales bacterium]
MSNYRMAEANHRIIPLEDKIFGINQKAKKMAAEEGSEKVINATIGSLLDDNGNLVILSSVVEVLKNLTSLDYAEYAPIAGTPDFIKAIKRAAFGSYVPRAYTEVVATPGGTGAIRNTIQNYSKRGDQVLTSDWYWGPYSTIAQDIERTIATFTLTDDKGKFNAVSFESKVKELLSIQDGLVVILNTPAHNPTGYSLDLEDWNNVINIIKNAVADGKKKLTLLVDVAYLDYAGDEEEYRKFFPLLEGLPENILVVVAYSLSKSYTMYGMRSGAMICMTGDKEIADEFKTVCAFSARGTWSNCNRAAMATLARIFSDEILLSKVTHERQAYCKMLVQRGKSFQKSANDVGLNMVPFDAGFFVTVRCENADAVGLELQKEGIFTVPVGKGLRVSVASISEDKCKTLPISILKTIKKVNEQ